MQRNNIVTVRLTDQERAELKQLSEFMRRSASGTLREALLEAARVIAEHREPRPTDRIRIEAVQS